ncbi:MAG: RsmE family RNA methyltransferase [Thermoanaerobaculia bacterium]
MAENALACPPRVLVPDLAEQRGATEEEEKEKEILLRKEERDHVRSRRLRDGDEVVVIDGKGARARAVLARGGSAIALLPSKKIFSSSSSPLSLPGEPANRVTVLLACAEPARVEWAIEKGTECGAAGFVLLDAERSQRAHVAALAKRIPRLIRIAEESTKQCNRTLVPFVKGPERLEDSLRRRRGEGALFVADPRGVPITSFVASASPGAMTLAIGPEGGFASAEIFLFKENLSLFLSLGPRILRLETAVVAALARLVDSA